LHPPAPGRQTETEVSVFKNAEVTSDYFGGDSALASDVRVIDQFAAGDRGDSQKFRKGRDILGERFSRYFFLEIIPDISAQILDRICGEKVRRQKSADHDLFKVDLIDFLRCERQHLPPPGPPRQKIRVSAPKLPRARPRQQKCL